MTYSIFGPTPLFATDVLLESLVVVVLVVPPTIIAGGLWAGYMKDIDIFDDDYDDYKEVNTDLPEQRRFCFVGAAAS